MAFGVLLALFPEMTHSMNIATMMTMRMGNSALRMNLLTVTLLDGWLDTSGRSGASMRLQIDRPVTVAYPPDYSKEPAWSMISAAASGVRTPMKSSVRKWSARSRP